MSANLSDSWGLAVVTYCKLLLRAPTCFPEAASAGLNKSSPFLVCVLITDADNSLSKRALSSRVAYYTVFKDPVHVAFTASIHKKSPCLGAVSSLTGH